MLGMFKYITNMRIKMLFDAYWKFRFITKMNNAGDSVCWAGWKKTWNRVPLVPSAGDHLETSEATQHLNTGQKRIGKLREITLIDYYLVEYH